MSQNEEVDKVVKGEPTKDFFITMLIKDISLRDAIGDLVDNSVDAIKSKAPDPDVLDGYVINIIANTEKFFIGDNGSGIEEDIARKYAFKLGKPKDHKLLQNSIGRFGIGMKRAFFKLGNNIVVNSIAPTSSFTMVIPVNVWRTKEELWDFEFKSVEVKQNNLAESTGTTIDITDLTNDAKENFAKVQFENELISEIAREQVINIGKGLKIVINDDVLLPEPITIKYNKEIVPSYWKHTFKHTDQESKVVTELDVEVYAGVGDEAEDEGGWCVFCNDRLIMDRDTSDITGWTGAGGDGVAKYHQQFWAFRGYVFFKAKDPTLLPWNTTKTGLDPESIDYIAVRKKMIEMMKDVFLLLNRQKKEREKDNPIKNQVLNNKINAAVAVPITQVIKDKAVLTPKFQFPQEINAVKEKDVQTIKYSVSLLKYNKAKKALKSPNPSDVGSQTFDYFFENEIGD